MYPSVLIQAALYYHACDLMAPLFDHVHMELDSLTARIIPVSAKDGQLDLGTTV